MSEEFKTVSQIAQESGIPEPTIRKWIRERKLQAYKPDSRIRIRAQDFQRFMESTKLKAGQDQEVMSLLKEVCA
jgi:excisionase family DNA binding protein